MRFLAAIALALTAGCRATPTPEPPRVLAVQPAAQAGGAAGAVGCLMMLLRALELEPDAEAEVRFGPERLELSGLDLRELRDYLRGRGLSAEVVRGEPLTARGLQEWLAGGLPVVLALNDDERGPRLALVHGVSVSGRWAIVTDALEGCRVLGVDELDARWRPLGRVLLAVAKAPGPAPSHARSSR